MLQKPKKSVSGSKKESKRKYIFLLRVLPILLLTILIFSNSVKNDFLGWDDNLYVTKNIFIKDTSLSGFKQLLLSDNIRYKGIRMTLLSFALINKFWGLNPKAFHIVNLLFHLLNIVLVFYLVKLLFQRIEIATITALFFAIHPLHVESVAWISELKDVQYSFYFLLALLFYVYYIKKGFSIYYLLLSIVCFYLSLYSKIAANALPFILILLDFYYKRKINIRLILEKLSFFILVAYHTLFPMLFSQKTMEIVKNRPRLDINFTWMDRFFFSCYSLSFYIIKFFAPFKLTLIHPYPEKESGILPTEYYLSPFFLIVIVGIIVWGWYKVNKYRNEFVFGLLFFLISISLYTHIIPIKGISIVAERYTYLAYIGLLICVGHVYCLIADKKTVQSKTTKTYFLLLLFLFGISFSFISWERTKVWKNDLTLFTDVIDKNPDIDIAYLNRGNYKKQEGDINGAIADFNRFIQLNPNYPYAYNNLGVIKAGMQDYQGALEDYNKAIAIDSNYVDAYSNRSLVRKQLKDYKGMIEDCNKAVELKPTFIPLYNNRASARYLIQDYKGSLEDCDKAIGLAPSAYWEVYNNRGNIRNKLEDVEGALQDFSKAIQLKPDVWDIYNNRGSVMNKLQQYDAALLDFNKAIQLYPNGMSYFNRGISFFYLQDRHNACNDWQQAIQLGFNQAEEYFRQYCR